ncbi:MAG: hypothetical protein A2284_09595 [Deltaproteobacteria bacterium RIFOXYA12_FULL_61_11]|nr:MAG: hypothetical protein A2284_09595 [Deltaproteobacteria bacterium RIFOXYA12_FULL_61_11]
MKIVLVLVLAGLVLLAGRYTLVSTGSGYALVDRGTLSLGPFYLNLKDWSHDRIAELDWLRGALERGDLPGLEESRKRLLEELREADEAIDSAADKAGDLKDEAGKGLRGAGEALREQTRKVDEAVRDQVE